MKYEFTHEEYLGLEVALERQEAKNNAFREQLALKTKQLSDLQLENIHLRNRVSELQTHVPDLESVERGEPVAWRYKFKEDLQWQYTENKEQAHRLAEVRALFEQPSRQPMSDEQREYLRYRVNQRNFPVGKEDFKEYVRLVEKFHGIGGTK